MHVQAVPTPESGGELQPEVGDVLLEFLTKTGQTHNAQHAASPSAAKWIGLLQRPGLKPATTFLPVHAQRIPNLEALRRTYCRFPGFWLARLVSEDSSCRSRRYIEQHRGTSRLTCKGLANSLVSVS